MTLQTAPAPPVGHRELLHRIGGEDVGVPAHERRNPARPDVVVAVTPAAAPDDARRAVDAAIDAASGWRATPAPARGAILTAAAALLRERASLVAADLCAEEGKTLAEARGEVLRAADILAFFGGEGWRLGGEILPASQPRVQLSTRREPLGVVALITPWNFPIAIPTWKLAPALIAGNAVVIKPAELTPLSVAHLSDVLVEAGLPDGVLNVVYGQGSTLGGALVADPRVAAVSFTGSTGVGRTIHEAASGRMARVQLEMGGKNAVVVLDDADPVEAARIIAAGAFGLTGQACTATSRVICTPGIHDAVVDALSALLDDWAPGDGAAEGVRMGPVIDEGQRRSIAGHIDRARAEGARLVGGGTHDGLRFAPTVFDAVEPEMQLAREEAFGPVVAVLRADDPDAAIALVNDSAYGLTAGIVTTDLERAMDFAERVEVGVVKVNRPTTGLELHAPFGGTKASSTDTFREQGATATEFYTRTKTVYIGW